MAKRICCDVCYNYKVGPFKEVESFVVCYECFEKLKACDDFMAEEHFNGTEWDNLSEEAAEHHMHTDAAAGSAKSGDVQPSFFTVKPGGSTAAPVM